MWRVSVVVSIFGLVIGAAGQTYTIDTVAGGGLPHTPIMATAASVQPVSVAADGAGNVYFSSGTAVFKVDIAGILTRVAGSPGEGLLGDGARHPAQDSATRWA